MNRILSETEIRSAELLSRRISEIAPYVRESICSRFILFLEFISRTYVHFILVIFIFGWAERIKSMLLEMYFIVTFSLVHFIK